MNRTDLTQTISLAEIAGLGPQVYTEPLDPQRTALIIVDMQGYTDDSMHVRNVRQREMEQTLGGCERLLTAGRQFGIKVIHVILGSWTLDGSDLSEHKRRANEIYRSQGKDPIAMRQWDAPSQQIMPSLAPVRGEVVLQKTSGSAFATTGLAGILHNMGVKYTVFAGQLTEGCMGVTAIEAHSIGFVVTLADGACYGASVPAHLAIMRMFDQHWGRVRTVDEIVAEFAGDAK